MLRGESPPFVGYASRALKAVLTCPRFASLFLPPFWLYRFMWNNRLGKVSEEQQQRNSGSVCVVVRGVATWPRLGKPATLCACLLCAAVPSSSGGDLENPLLIVRLIGHVAFQTFSGCLFSTRKVPDAAGCCYKAPRPSLNCTSHLSMPRH